MITANVGKFVCFKYPTNGWRNVLRNVCGTVKAVGVGPNGTYIKVDTNRGHRTYSLNKIVSFKTP